MKYKPEPTVMEVLKAYMKYRDYRIRKKRIDKKFWRDNLVASI
jgi:hypothetical protein